MAEHTRNYPAGLCLLRDQRTSKICEHPVDALRYPTFCHKATDDLVIWSIKRDVRVDKLYITKESDLAIYREYLLERGRTVTTIEYHAKSFRDVGMQFIAAIATYCPNLESFDLSAYEECLGLDALLRDILVNMQL